jgi:hypothetical protein
MGPARRRHARRIISTVRSLAPSALHVGRTAVGLAAVNAYAQSAKGAPFATLAAQDQDAVLSDMEKNVAKSFTPNSSAFFNLVRTHTIQGMYGAPPSASLKTGRRSRTAERSTI